MFKGATLIYLLPATVLRHGAGWSNLYQILCLTTNVQPAKWKHDCYITARNKKEALDEFYQEMGVSKTGAVKAVPLGTVDEFARMMRGVSQHASR